MFATPRTNMNPSSLLTRRIWVVVAVWLSGITLIGFFGWGVLIPPPLRGPLVALAIAAPFLTYLYHPGIRGIIGRIPDAAIVAFHSWRALAGFAFLACGHSGLLPAVFVRNAGYGDLAVAALVPFVLLLPETRQKYLWFHIAGLTDFVFAVGTGLYFTMRGNPLMDYLFSFPMIVIPWFAVSVSGASHLITLHRLLTTNGTRKA